MTREFEVISKQFGRDTGKALMKFTRGSKLKILSVLKGKDHKVWIKLTSGKTKRISSSLFDMAKPFVNSHFYYQEFFEVGEDIEGYNYKYIGDKDVLGHNCYMIEVTLKKSKMLYSKRVIYLRKSDYMGMRADFYMKGKLHKYLVNHEMKKIQGHMTPVKGVMRMAGDDDEKTVLEARSVKYDVKLKNSQFTL